MGQDGQPKHRQAGREIKRKTAVRGIYERVLIVCEGTKTEPNYLNEIRSHLKLHTANVVIRASDLGTAPIQVVKYAEQLFQQGDSHYKLRAKEFDRIYAVFDRDDHSSFHEALMYCHRAKHLKNKDRKIVPLIAIPSLPCFEIWLLLHFEEVRAPLHRDEVYARLRNHLPDYEKGISGYWLQTMGLLRHACERAQAFITDDQQLEPQPPYTKMAELVQYLIMLKA
jgi:hypothetical protein